ncbi:hypothetical protein ASPWEDRAFT_34512 [Aspergillus wentii DTO 134E9]|uniref:Uncharacterized protein n=1 Tax=Aspergillus wentii DTO 134E9 TaxID=1073089 RepID=A0A1L9S1J6_ASPWE|nr:uncharacterized protein ASPWEDRAFT_34512 [Aspergillus wentii DTO 134E9]OJJ41037.1 hypothetical protein ASPWEDRAFT_34512 [Aspergillus wentii DTO 134E9]
MADAGTPYAEIGQTVLCNLDLRNDQDYPLYKDVEVGDPHERPRQLHGSSQLHRARDPLLSPTVNDDDDGPPHSDSSLSSASVHLHPESINVVRWPFFKDEDDLERFTKGDDPEDRINSEARPEPRSKKGEMSLRQVPRSSRFYEHLDESLSSEQEPTIARHASSENLRRGKLRKRR